MTLIAHFRSFENQTLVSDLLLSSHERPPRQISIPAARSINERIFLPPRHFIAGLSQKLVLLGEHITVAWSKSYQQAADLTHTLAPLAALGPIDPYFLDSTLSAIEPERKNDLSYVVCGIDAEGRQHLFSHDVIGPQNIGLMSEVLCAGTGAPTFLEVARQLSGNFLLMNPTAMTSELRQGFDLGFLRFSQVKSFRRQGACKTDGAAVTKSFAGMEFAFKSLAEF